MLQVWTPHSLDGPPVARLEHLAGELVLATWESSRDAGTPPLRPKIDGALAPRPYLMLSVPHPAGGSRHAALLHWPGRKESRFSAEADDETVATAIRSADRELPKPDGAALMSGLAPAARRRLVRGLFAHLAGIGARMPGAADAAAALIAALWPDRAALRPLCRVTSHHVLFDGKGSMRLGALQETFLLSPSGLRSLRRGAMAGQPRGDARHVMAVLPDTGDATEVVFLGSSGLATFRLDPAGRHAPPPLLAWAERQKGKSAGLDGLAALLQEIAGTAPEAAAALLELQLLTPGPTGRIALDTPSLQALVELAVADGAGLVVAGWIDDPQQLAAGLALERDDASPLRFADRFHRFPRRLGKGRGKESETRLVEGFIAYLPEAPEAQRRLRHRFQLLLRSGGGIPLAAPAQPADPTAARAAVLGSLAPDAVTPAILRDCLAPAIAALHRRCMQTARNADAVPFGASPAVPQFTIIIPLYRNLEFLKFQIASLAVDPDRHRSEILYVLDSPEQRLEVEHLMRGLWRLHDLPMTLLINPANLGYAAANNLAAARARGRTLALVNSDVLPIEPGWLGALDRRLVAQPRLGAVGPKLLFEDQSLQHAGMYFAQDSTGRWLNHHYSKGLPRYFPAAQVERPVPALTGACLVVRRDAFEAVGGFTEDYVIGDYEDSDLCLKLRREGYDLAYVPEVELYHLERRSIRHHAGYMKGVACLYNSWLHAQRWHAEMTRLAERGDEPTPDCPVAVRNEQPRLDAAAE